MRLGFVSWVFIGVSAGAVFGLYKRLQRQMPDVHQPGTVVMEIFEDGSEETPERFDLNDPALMQAMEAIVEDKVVDPNQQSEFAAREAEENRRTQQQLRRHWEQLDVFEDELARIDRWADRAQVYQEMTDVFFQTEDARLRWTIMKSFEGEIENLSAKEMDFDDATEANTHLVFLLRRYWEFASYSPEYSEGGRRLDKIKDLRISSEMREFVDAYIHLGGDF